MKQKPFFLSITQIPVRTYMKTKQQKPGRKGQVSSQPCDTSAILKSPDQKQTLTQETKKGKTR